MAMGVMAGVTRRKEEVTRRKEEVTRRKEVTHRKEEETHLSPRVVEAAIMAICSARRRIFYL